MNYWQNLSLNIGEATDDYQIERCDGAGMIIRYDKMEYGNWYMQKGDLITDCPFEVPERGSEFKVGGKHCKKCKHYGGTQSRDETGGEINCNFQENN